MPSRLIKESICTSESMASLSWFEQALFIRLIVTVDDYGRMDGRPAVLRGRMFSLEDVSVKDVRAGLHKLSAAGMVLLYEVSGKPYLQLTTWNRHQTPRAKESKYPPPPTENKACDQLQAVANTCKQLQTDENSGTQILADAPDIRYSNSIFGIRDTVCAEDGAAASTLPPAVIYLPLNDKTEYRVDQKQLDEWSGLYPAVDVMQELRKMKGWLDSNPKKRKTRGGIKRFIVNWLASEQDKGRKNINTKKDEIDWKVIDAFMKG